MNKPVYTIFKGKLFKNLLIIFRELCESLLADSTFGIFYFLERQQDCKSADS